MDADQADRFVADVNRRGSKQQSFQNKKRMRFRGSFMLSRHNQSDPRKSATSATIRDHPRPSAIR
jgi:hypothetical protein